jgi:hypothetical protein
MEFRFLSGSELVLLLVSKKEEIMSGCSAKRRVIRRTCPLCLGKKVDLETSPPPPPSSSSSFLLHVTQ